MSLWQKGKDGLQKLSNSEVMFVSNTTSTATTNSLVLKKSLSSINSASTASSCCAISLTTTSTANQSDGGVNHTLQQQGVITSNHETDCIYHVSTNESSTSPFIPTSQTHTDLSDASSGSRVIAHHVKKRLLSCQRMLRLEAEKTTKKQSQLLQNTSKDARKTIGTSSSSVSTLSASKDEAVTSISERPKQSHSEYDFPDSPDNEELVGRTSAMRYLSYSAPSLKCSQVDNSQLNPSSDSKMASSTADTSFSPSSTNNRPVVSQSS